MTKNEFLSYLHDENFTQLFLECFWNNPTTTQPYRFRVGEDDYEAKEVAQKGLKVFLLRCENIPDSSVRRIIDSRLRKASHDYLAIFVSTTEDFHHLWSVPVKAVDKRQLVTVEYQQDDQAVFLLEKMNAITFSPDSIPTIVDVVNQVNAAFLVNTTEVTKKFYQSFRKQHNMFVKEIENISSNEDREWYASVMLNRLMFCYFIQKKRFLNLDENYLGNKLKEIQAKKGKDKFYESFYRSFLKQLFSDGLDKPVTVRSDYFTRKYGRIPYLNGGMFSMHQIEKENKDIDIPDKVFELLFAFFDEWHWHLDSRITASGKDINPDVLGYIFEQYINDRAQMGAYYTKEDITEYIGRNCIVPYLMEEAKRQDAKPFSKGGAIWKDFAKSGDRYIFEAVRKGVDIELPPEIEKGVDVSKPKLRERRANWNKPTPEEYALPTEIWRETIARRQRCESIREKIANGEIADIHDFITYNLDIRAFAEDVIRNTDDHKLVLHFYKALRNVTILDPTCGSGAFLFAALNILEPLYEACLDRMEEFHAKNEKLFKDELAEITGKFRSNQQYFIYKNIILRNLYGVDIMHEATEIARLRLFLKMVAVVDVDEYDPNLGLNPLPDIDFNIRCGNTLVGYATEKEIEDGLVNGDMFAYVELKGKIDEEMKKVSMAFDFFKKEQLNLQGDHRELVKAKEEINLRLKKIRTLLDDQLYNRYSGKKKDQWLKDTQPFHWYTEFYPIMHGRGGFDVIIGNPPYVEYSKVKNYKIKDYKTESCGNLYAFVVERSLKIAKDKNHVSFIVPLTISSNNNMHGVRDLIVNSGTVHFSHFETRPSRLFEGADQRLTIFIISQTSNADIYSTSITRWNSEHRDDLFKIVFYGNAIVEDRLWRISNNIERSIYKKISKHHCTFQYRVKELSKKGTVWYRTAGVRYWIIFSNNGFGTESLSNKVANFSSKEQACYFMAAFNSNLFWWYYALNFDMFNLKDYMIFGFRLDYKEDKKLSNIAHLLDDDLIKNRQEQSVNRATLGSGSTFVYRKKLSKPIIDEIDELLAKHYGFTEEELDFIINYDIKYRMGDELNA